MPKVVEKWGIISILGTLFAAGIIGSASIVVAWASHVPKLEQTLVHLNETLVKSNKVQELQTKELKEVRLQMVKDKAATEKTMSLRAYQIERLMVDCGTNRADIELCKTKHYKPFDMTGYITPTIKGK